MRDPIKGLKLRRFDAYLGGAAVGEGEKESLIYCGSYIYCQLSVLYNYS